MEVIQFILFSFLNYNGVCGTVALTREISCVLALVLRNIQVLHSLLR